MSAPGGLDAAWRRLLDALVARGSLLVSLSGGADSSLLLAAAVEALGAGNVKAALCAGSFTPPWDLAFARDLAARLGVELIEIDTGELSDPAIAANDPDRCYLCKRRRLMLLTHICQERGLAAVAEGGQLDDADEHRPGARAVAELGALSPLAEAGLGKAEVRALGRRLNLPAADAPSSACLATRIPTGAAISPRALTRVARAETAVRALHPGQVRVRDHFPLARLELDADGLARLGEPGFRQALHSALIEAGYTLACVDLAGYHGAGA